MKYSYPVIIKYLFIVATIVFTFLFSVFADPRTVSADAEAEKSMSVRIDRLINEVKAMQEQNEKLAKMNDDIVEMIKNLKIWAHKR